MGVKQEDQDRAGAGGADRPVSLGGSTSSCRSDPGQERVSVPFDYRVKEVIWGQQ